MMVVQLLLLLNVGTATVVKTSNSGGSDTNIVVNALGGIDVGDLVVVAGVGTGETMTVTGITTNSALQPTAVMIGMIHKH